MGISKNAVLVTEKIDELTNITDLMYVFEYMVVRLNSVDDYVIIKNSRSTICIGTKRLMSFVKHNHNYYFKYKNGYELETTSRLGRRLVSRLNANEYICIKRGKYISVSGVNVATDNMVFLIDKSCHFMSRNGKVRLEKRLKECYHGARNFTGDKDDDK